MLKPEVPTEHLHEHMERHAHGAGEKWLMGVALSSAILAALAAVASLKAEMVITEAIVDQFQMTDYLLVSMSRGVREEVITSKIELLRKQYHKAPSEDEADLKKTSTQRHHSQDLLNDWRNIYDDHIDKHGDFSKAVTLFQVAIAVGAISALVRRKLFWFLSMGFGTIGLFFLILGYWG